VGQGKGEGKFGSLRSDNEAQLDFIVASTTTGPPLVLLDFRRMVDHLHLTPEQARSMADGLIDAARDADGADQGRILRVAKLNGK
jgi:hypothetical protein